MENLLYESRATFQWEVRSQYGHHRLQTYYIRCWRQEDTDFDVSEAPYITELECKQALKEIVYGEKSNVKVIAEALIKLPRMNAVEVLDNYKIGIVIYKNWP